MKSLPWHVARACIVAAPFIFLPPNSLHAQRPPDSLKTIEQEIFARPETGAALLGKSRSALFESIAASDSARVRKIVAFMSAKFDSSRYVILFPQEDLIVKYWLRDYDGIFAFSRAPRWLIENEQVKILPERDLLSIDLRRISSAEIGALSAGIAQSGRAQDQKDFLTLFLQDLLGPVGADDGAQKAFRRGINLAADEFLLDHPGSLYVPFVREYIRYVVGPSPFGLGYELALGYLGLPKNLHPYWDDRATLTVAFEGAIWDNYGSLRLDVGIPRATKKEFVHDGTWTQGLEVSSVTAFLAAGRMLYPTLNTTVTPQIGIGYTDFGPPRSDHADMSLGFAVWGFGVNGDIQLGEENLPMLLRLYAGYRSSITSIEMVKGGYVVFSIGLGYFTRGVVRER